MKTLKRLMQLALALMLAGCTATETPAATTSAASAEPTTAPQAAETTAAAETADPEEAEAETEAETAPADRIVMAVTSTSTDCSPFGTISQTRTYIQELLYAPLFYIQVGHFLEDAEPYIGKSISKVDDYTYDIEIFDNITDSKGNPIKAEDIIWSYEQSAEKRQFSAYVTKVEEFKAVDDTHLTLKLNTTLPGTIESLVCANNLTIVSKEWCENATDEELMNSPATTGPYEVKSIIDGSEVVVTARENYWKTNEADMNKTEQRNVKEVVLKVVTEESMRSIGLETGELDFASVGVTNLHRFYENGASKEGYDVWIGQTTPSFACVYMNMDTNSNSLFAQDVNLRKAALYAIDSEALMYAKGYDEDTATVLKGFGNTTALGYQDSWADEDYFDYNPELAKEYLHKAGYEDGEVEITVLTTMQQPDTIRSVLISNLEEAGFKVNNYAVEQALYMKYSLESDQWDLCYGTKGFSTSVVSVWDACFNPSGWSNGSMCFTHDEKLEELLDAVSKDSSDENINIFNQYLKDNAICKALFEMDSINVAREGVHQELGFAAFSPSASTYDADFESAPSVN